MRTPELGMGLARHLLSQSYPALLNLLHSHNKTAIKKRTPQGVRFNLLLLILAPSQEQVSG